MCQVTFFIAVVWAVLVAAAIKAVVLILRIRHIVSQKTLSILNFSSKIIAVLRRWWQKCIILAFAYGKVHSIVNIA